MGLDGKRRWASFVFLLALLMAQLVVGCSSDEKKADSAEELYKSAQRASENGMNEEAIRRFNQVKSKHPYSQFAILAELGVADSHFNLRSYPEAQVAYQNFREMHPKFSRIDYVIYRLGLSYYHQIPSSASRDLALAPKAIGIFEELLKLYPNFESIKDAKEKRDAAISLLGEKEIYIADFYFRTGKWDSARLRYENAVRKYTGQSFEARALSRAAISSVRSSEINRAKEFLEELQKRFPQNRLEIEEAQKEIQKGVK